MSAGQPVVVYIDDDAGARGAFERAFERVHRVVATPASPIALHELRQPAVLVFDAATLGTVGREVFVQLAEQHPHATRMVIARPWQEADLAQLLATACAAWTRSTASALALSHDLRTPLMALLSDAEHLSDLAETAPTLREALMLVARDMQRAARQMQQVVERIEI